MLPLRALPLAIVLVALGAEPCRASSADDETLNSGVIIVVVFVLGLPLMACGLALLSMCWDRRKQSNVEDISPSSSRPGTHGHGANKDLELGSIKLPETEVVQSGCEGDKEDDGVDDEGAVSIIVEKGGSVPGTVISRGSRVGHHSILESEHSSSPPPPAPRPPSVTLAVTALPQIPRTGSPLGAESPPSLGELGSAKKVDLVVVGGILSESRHEEKSEEL